MVNSSYQLITVKTTQKSSKKLMYSKMNNTDLVIDGIHFGRGDSCRNAFVEEKSSTTKVKCWKIVNDELEEIESESLNSFYDSETYIVRRDSVTIDGKENTTFFYWKGDNASKGYSPLPEEIEKDNPPVERIMQWSEPPAFLRLFTGKFIVHTKKYDDQRHLYILRGEIEEELHLFEVPAKRESLRSRTSFVLVNFEKKSTTIWHGSLSSVRCRKMVRQIVEKVFVSEISEFEEGSESAEFLETIPADEDGYFVDMAKKIIDYTPRLFYLNKITGNFLATEIECSHRSKYNTPFPFLQSHLYTAFHPAFFLLDDNDEIWLWQGWYRNEDDDFRSKCFTTTINYAKHRSKIGKKLIKVQKVIAGFEPINFTNLFPTWGKRKDVIEIQKKDGVLPRSNLLIAVNPLEKKQ